MPYFRVDDGMWGHPKFEEASDAAIALWTKAGSWCARYLTDGVVPAARIPRLNSTPEAAAELVALGLWETHLLGFAFHQWAEFQGTKADVEIRRKQDAERKRLSRSTKSLVKSEMSGVTPAGVPERRGEENSLSDSSLPQTREAPHPQLSVVRSEPLRAELPDNFPQRCGSTFQNLYMARYRLDPNMGGKSTYAFPSQLENTARMRSVDPLELMAQCFERWTQRKPGNDRERKFQREFPYAAFVGAFGGLVAALGDPDGHWPGFELSAPVGDRYASSKPLSVPETHANTISSAEVARQAEELLARIKTQGART